MKALPERPEAQLVERDGFLVVDLGPTAPLELDANLARKERGRQLVHDAMRR